MWWLLHWSESLMENSQAPVVLFSCLCNESTLTDDVRTCAVSEFAFSPSSSRWQWLRRFMPNKWIHHCHHVIIINTVAHPSWYLALNLEYGRGPTFIVILEVIYKHSSQHYTVKICRHPVTWKLTYWFMCRKLTWHTDYVKTQRVNDSCGGSVKILLTRWLILYKCSGHICFCFCTCFPIYPQKKAVSFALSSLSLSLMIRIHLCKLQ